MFKHFFLPAAAALCAVVGGCGGMPGESEIEAGIRALEQGRNEQCIRSMEKALSLNPDDRHQAVAHNCVGIAHWRTGRADLAALAFESSMDLDPALADPVFNLGVLMAESGMPSNAVAFLEKAALIESTGTMALEYLAYLHEIDQNWKAAAQALGEAQRRSPGSPGIITSIASLELRTGSVSRAVSGFQRALENDASYAPAIYNLAVVNEHWLNDKEQALAYFEDYLRMAPDGEQAGVASEAVEALRKAADATGRAVAIQAPEPPPPKPPVSAQKAEPRPRRDAPVRTSPDYEEYMRMAGVLAEQGRVEGSVHNFLLAADLSIRAGETARAERAEKAALSAAGENARARYALGSYLVNHAKTNEALTQFRMSAELAADWAAPHLALGELLVERGELDAAIVCLKQADRADPADPTPLWLMAVLYDRNMGLKNRAIQCYTWFIRRFSDDARSESARERLSVLEGDAQ